MFTGCFVLKTDANITPGFPDLIILFENKWAALECKRSANDLYRPNQEYYINECNKMSYASVIYPENKEEILNELQQAFGLNRTSRFPRR